VAIFTHQRPDPDAVGSQLGLAHILNAAGKTGVVIEFPPVPETLGFILEVSPWPVVEFNPDRFTADLPQFDRVLVVDTSSRDQLAPAAEILKSAADRMYCIDHHLAGNLDAALIYRDSSAGSCAEMIVRLSGEFGGMNTPAARALLAGITGDTGWFHFESTSADTLLAAAECVRAGARPEELWNRLMQQDSVAKWRLAGRVLQSAQYLLQGQLAVLKIPLRDFTDAGAKSWETEGFINLPLSIADVLACACLTEQSDGTLRISLRSKHTINVADIAAEFGGGGHARAAGCRLPGPMEDACRAVVAAFERRMRLNPSSFQT
jgi:phosphoesterase RecJ-like protein